jgi:alpha-glucoside transport system substrate-binding protein
MSHRFSDRRFLTLLVLLAVVTLTPACGTGSTSNDGGTVTLQVSESPPEEAALQDHVLAEFTRETGIRVIFQPSTRALDQVLQAELQTGTQPDVAILPSPGQLQTFASQGVLQPIDSALGNQTNQYGPQWASLEHAIQESGPGSHVYAVPIKIALKSAIWYNPTALQRLLGASWDGTPPVDWQQLIDLTNLITAHGGTPWCMGMESTPVSGWPGTDWIEDILLHQSGPETYGKWADGMLPWPGPGPIAQAFGTWQLIVDNPKNIAGGTEGALLTNFADASTPLFNNPPGCYLDHTAYIDNSKNTHRPGVDFSFFPFPTINGNNGVEVSADFAAVFRATPQAESLIRFLASDVGQRLWPAVPGIGAFSANRTVTEAVYPDVVSKQVAYVLAHANTLCFDASDLMPSAMSYAFNQAILAYLSNPDPRTLDASLAELESVRVEAYKDTTSNYQCGTS